MTRFNFRLQTLLRLRQAVRDRRRARLAEAYQAERILQQQTEELARQLDRIKRQMRRAAQPGQVDVDSLLASHRYELLLRAQQEQLKGQIEQIAEEIESRRQLLVEADRQLRVVQKLRDRQREAHHYQQRKQEINATDEVAARCRPAAE